MQYLIDFFRSLGEIITSIVDFVIDFFKGIVEFFVNLPDYIETITLYVEILPDSIKAIAVMTISLTLIFVVVGRRGK